MELVKATKLALLQAPSLCSRNGTLNDVLCKREIWGSERVKMKAIKSKIWLENEKKEKH